MKSLTKRMVALLISIFVVASTCLSGVEFSVRADDSGTETYDITVTYCHTEARSMLEYVNEFRTSGDAWYWNTDNTEQIECGKLDELEYDYALEEVAMQRAAELAVFYSHTRPNGDTTWTAYSDCGYYYTAVAENIATGQTSAESAFTSWKEENAYYSGQGHRRAMLGISTSLENRGYTRIAIACVKYNGCYFWVMELAKSSSTNSYTDALDGEKTVSVEISDSLITNISTSLSASSYTLFEGDTAETPTLTTELTVDGTWPYGETISSTTNPTWSSSDTTVVKISDSEISALSSGQTEITATAYGETFTVPVYVYSEPSFDWSSDFTTCTAIFTCGTATKDVDCTITKTDSLDVTCTSDGYNEYTASVTFGGLIFTDVVTEEIEATGHTWDEGVVTTKPTCTATGVKTYTCDVCGEIKTEIISATGHTIEEVLKNDATCTEDGNEAYYVCTSCGTYFSDVEGTDEIAENSWIIEATGHTWNEGVVTTKPTCTEVGVRTYTCETCGEIKTEEIAATGHTIELVAPKTDATCTEDGNEEYYQCTSCGTYFSDMEGTDEIAENSWIIEATGHTWDEGVVTTKPTCTEVGVRTYTCETCGEIKTEEIAATGHTIELVAPKTDATCTEDGNEEYYICTSCGTYFSDAEGMNEIKEDEWIIEATGHNIVLVSEEKKATCTDAGNSEYYMCTSCGTYFSDAEGENEIEEGSWVIDATGHTWDDGVIVEEPTEYEDGIIMYTCTSCGEKLYKSITATGHEHSYGTPSWIWTKTDDGYSVSMTLICADDTCGNEVVEIAEVTSVITKEANGEILYTATVTYGGITYTTTKTDEIEAENSDDSDDEDDSGSSTDTEDKDDSGSSADTEDKNDSENSTDTEDKETEGKESNSDNSTSTEDKETGSEASSSEDLTETDKEVSGLGDSTGNTDSTTNTNNTTYTEATENNETTEMTEKNISAASVDVGSIHTVGSYTYKVTNAATDGTGTVTLAKADTSKTTVKIPATIKINGNTYKVTAIGKNAFAGCKKLKKVTIGKNVTTIGKKAFYGCTKLKTLVIGKNVKKIGAKAFYNCKKLKSITIKSKKLKAKKVGSKAFGKVKAKVKIKVPKSKLKAYKKMLYKKGISKKAKIS